MKLFWILVLVTVQMECTVSERQTEKSNILLVPLGCIKNSHGMTMEKMALFLTSNGYDVTFLVDDNYPLSEQFLDEGIKTIFFTLPEVSTILSVFKSMFDLDDLLQISPIHFLQGSLNLNNLMCDALFSNKTLVNQLQQMRFDLMIMDEIWSCNQLFASYLDIPMIGYHVIGLGRLTNTDIPVPPSYVPVADGECNLIPSMTFRQRVANTITFLIRYGVVAQLFSSTTKRLQYKHQINEVTNKEILRFINDDFSVAFPTPVLPDMVFVGGAFFKLPQPLSIQFEEIVQNSGKHGVIIFSFGTLISMRKGKWRDLFLDAFSRLPYTVIWNYKGKYEGDRKIPRNVQLVEWMPQTDLLAHPKTRLFITHCGLNSALETAFYGVPVIAIPIYGDNHHHAARLTYYHQAGVYLDISTLTADELYMTITKTINNETFKQNAVKMSLTFKDSQSQAKEKILYWIDWAKRHNASSHLIGHGRQLTWYQYYLVDVILYLTLVLVGFVSLMYYCFRMTKNFLCNKKQKAD